MTLAVVQKVYTADKTKDKSHFNAVITGIYWIYRPRGPYWNKSLSDRIKLVNEEQLAKFSTTWEQLIKSPGVKQLTDAFIDLSSTINDRAFDNIRSDFESLIQALNAVPTKIDLEIPIETDAICGEDNKVRRIKRAVKIIVPTFDQKADMWSQYEKFSKILKSIEAALKLEDEERVKNGSDVYLYDGEDKKSNI